jgi:hypothetical protein
MIQKTKLTGIRIHLPSGEFFEGRPDEVSTAPPLGAFVKDPRTGAEVPLAPVVVLLHAKGSDIQRRFYGATIELIEEEQLIDEVTTSPIIARRD